MHSANYLLILFFLLLEPVELYVLELLETLAKVSSAQYTFLEYQAVLLFPVLYSIHVIQVALAYIHTKLYALNYQH